MSDHWSFGNYTPCDLRRVSEWKNRWNIFKKHCCHRFPAIHCCFFVSTSLLAVTTVVGLFEILTVSESAELRSFLLTSCMLALESTTNSLSFWFYGGCGRQNPPMECNFFLWYRWLTAWTGFSCRLCTVMTLVSETALVSSRTLTLCFPLIAISFPSLNAT